MSYRKRALVFEPCPYHYTLLGSYAYYLSELNYEVVLLVHESCDFEQDLYGAWQLVSEVHHFSDDNWSDAKSVISSGHFDLVWITTINIPFRDDGKNLFEVLGGYPCPPDGLFATLHDILQLEESRIDKTRFAAIFTLADKRKELPGSLPISLSYYGPPHLGNGLSHPISLLTVGVSVSLCGAMKYVAEDRHGEDYSVALIGRKTKLRFWGGPIYARLRNRKKGGERSFGNQGYPRGPLSLVRAMRKLEFQGQVSSETMYAEIKKADYLIANFEGEMLHIFSNLRVSGVTLLSLGFNVPMLVNETIAKSWGFDETNSIIFPDGRFDIALRRIKTITSHEYAQMQAALLEKQKRDLAKSIAEIQSAIAKWHILRLSDNGGK